MPNLRIPTPRVYWDDASGPTQPFKSWFALFESWIHLQNLDRETALGNAEKNNLLLLMLGSEGMQVLQTNPVVANIGVVTHQEFVDAVKATFSVPVNQVRARFDFFNRRQGSIETCSEYLSAMRNLAVDCAFCNDDCVKQHIATMLVVGCANKATQEKLLMEKTVDFDHFLEIVKTDESAREAASHIQASAPSTSSADIYAMNRQKRPTDTRGPLKHGKPKFGAMKANTSFSTPAKVQCRYCGFSHVFGKNQCPANNKRCNICHRNGHFAKCCVNRTVRSVELAKPGSSNGHCASGIDSLEIQCTSAGRTNAFRCHLMVFHNGRSIKLVSDMDTGSDVTTVPYRYYRSNLSDIPLRKLPNDTRFNGYGKVPIKGVHGTVQLTLGFKDRQCTLYVYVMPDHCKPIVGKDAINALRLQFDPATFEVSAIEKPDKASKLLAQYPRLLAPSIGKYPNYRHVIKVTDNAQPVVTKLRTVPLSRREAVKREIRKMVALGIWEPCEKSEWQHGMVTVPKADGSVRITTDLTPLNPYVIPNRYPLPNIKDMFLHLRGATYFSKLDLSKAYYTIAIAPESRPLTATVTDEGVFQYKCLPMGLKDSAAVFQRCVAETLEGIPGCMHYIEDILVYGSNRREHDMHLERTLAALNARNFQLNAEKCLLAQSSVPFLGHIITAEGIHASPRRIEPIKNSPAPKDVKGVQRFLGFVRYFQDCIPNLATVAEPLHCLTRKGVPFKWDAKCQKAFQTLLALLSKKILLSIFDPNAKTIVSTDASKVGLGASLSQMQNGREVFIAFASRTLRAHERNYAANEAEAVACLWAVEYWEKFLIGRPFVLRTDHAPLQTLLQKYTNSRSTAKFNRWRARLAAFEYTVEHRKGVENVVADTLSRMPLEIAQCTYDAQWESNIEAIIVESGLTVEGLKRATTADKFCMEILRYIETQNWPSKNQLTDYLKPFYALRHDFKADDRLIVRSDERIVVPAALRRKVLRMAHEGHPGIVRMKRKIKETYWWPNINTDVELFVKHCGPCQCSDKSCPPSNLVNKTLPAAGKPWQLVSVDITGPFAVAPHSQRFICVLLDHYSGFPEYATFDVISSSAIITWLEEVFARYGYPSELLSDNGKQFVSEEFACYLKSKGIGHRRAAVYNPQSNGKVEVFNRYLKYGVQTFSEGRWKPQLLNLVRSFRATASEPNGLSPAEKLHGWKMRLAFQPAKHHDPVNLRRGNGPEKEPRRGQEHVDAYDKVRGPYRPGQYVRVRRPPAHVLKGQSLWSKPLRVVRRVGSWSYMLSDGQLWNNRRMRRHFPPHPEEDDTINQPARTKEDVGRTTTVPKSETATPVKEERRPSPDTQVRRSQRTVRPSRRYSPSP